MTWTTDLDSKSQERRGSPLRTTHRLTLPAPKLKQNKAENVKAVLFLRTGVYLEGSSLQRRKLLLTGKGCCVWKSRGVWLDPWGQCRELHVVANFGGLDGNFGCFIRDSFGFRPIVLPWKETFLMLGSNKLLLGPVLLSRDCWMLRGSMVRLILSLPCFAFSYFHVFLTPTKLLGVTSRWAAKIRRESFMMGRHSEGLDSCTFRLSLQHSYFFRAQESHGWWRYRFTLESGAVSCEPCVRWSFRAPWRSLKRQSLLHPCTERSWRV